MYIHSFTHSFTFIPRVCEVWNLPLNSDLDMAINRVQRVKPALHEKSPLQTKGGDEEVESDSAEAVALQEGHEKAKTHKDHHMHILKTCRARKRVEKVHEWWT